MAPERLWVIRGNEVVADLERDAQDRLSLRFRPSVVDRAQGAAMISVSLPVREQPYDEPALLPFFEGLLPEGLVRERLATRFRLDPADVFGFLREIGRDCAGALSIVPAGTSLEHIGDEGVEWLDETTLAGRVAELAARPLADEPAENIRISLAGVQDKMAVVVDGDRIGLPRGTTPSTHILKPASAERRGDRLAYPSVVANEAFCTVLAANAGLRTVRVAARAVSGEAALLIERYDRASAGPRIVRVHQEDFCQALGVPSRRKYESDDGPGVAAYLDLLRRVSVDVLSDQPELLDRVAFNYLIGNADAHGKNFSILHDEGGARLAPAYDLLSTFVYPHLSKEMATAVSGIFDAAILKPVHWHKWFSQLEVSDRLYSARFADLAERVETAIPMARQEVTAWTLGNGVLDGVVKLVAQRVQLLKGLRGTTSPRP